MAVVNQLKRIKTNIKASYTALADKGAELPTKQNSDNLASTIANLEIGSSGSDEILKGIVEATATDIVLPDNIEKIANYFFYDDSSHAFYNKKITSLTANGVKEVGVQILYGHGCKSLREINLPKLEIIGAGGLRTEAGSQMTYCTVQKIKLGKLKSVGDSAFSGLFNPTDGITQKVEMSFEDCVVGKSAFGYYNLPSFDGTGIKSLGQQPFNTCGNNIKKIWLPSTIETITATDTKSGRLMSFYNANPSTAVTIYTDVASEEEAPTGWGAGWNCSSLSPYVTTVYGATYEDFLNAEV